MQHQIKISAVGDICAGDHYFTMGHGIASRTRQGVGERMFVEVSEILRSADIAICNLEGPVASVSNRNPPVECDVFRGDPRFLENLRNAGFTAINIANNHIMQHGEEAFRETLSLARSHDLDIVGLRSDGDYYSHPVIKNIRDQKIGLLGYSWVTERYIPNQREYALGDIEQISSDVVALKRRVDWIVVSIHNGNEGSPNPTREIVSACRAILKSGANIVLCHHTHVFQPVEHTMDGIVAYSLGDFVFDLYWRKDYVESAILELSLDCDRSIPSWSYNLVPVIFDPKYYIRVATGRVAKRILKRARMPIDGNTIDRKLSRIVDSLKDQYFQLKKILFFISNILKGDFKKKRHFIVAKARRFLLR